MCNRDLTGCLSMCVCFCLSVAGEDLDDRVLRRATAELEQQCDMLLVRPIPLATNVS
jgi:hypothetical protein